MAYKYNKELTYDQNVSRAQSYRFHQKSIHAKNSKHEWNIRYEDVEWNDVCPVFGTPINWLSEGKAQDNTPSFDRTDSDLGYVPGNVVTMSWRANKLKNNATTKELIALAEYMENN